MNHCIYLPRIINWCRLCANISHYGHCGQSCSTSVLPVQKYNWPPVLIKLPAGRTVVQAASVYITLASKILFAFIYIVVDFAPQQAFNAIVVTDAEIALQGACVVVGVCVVVVEIYWLQEAQSVDSVPLLNPI